MTKFNNGMLDLETLGNNKQSPLIQLAMVMFDPLTGETGKEFKETIDFDDAVKHGIVTGSTIKWWMRQSDDARASVTTDNTVGLAEALTKFSAFLSDIPFRDRTLWGNGSSFDCSILENAYEATGLKKPWSYSGDADVRTVVNIGRLLTPFDRKTEQEFIGTPHDALDDCKHQIRYVSAILRDLSCLKTQEAQ